MSEYNADSIKILSEDELKRFPWHRIETLATEANQPVDFIRNGFEAAYQVGEDPERFVKRYVYGDKSIVMSSEFVEAYVERLKNKRFLQ